MADDDWETDADHVNDLTEAEQRAYGNRETMLKYQSVMETSGASVPGGVTLAPGAKAPAPAMDVSDDAAPAAPASPAPVAAVPAAAASPPGKVQVPSMCAGTPDSSSSASTPQSLSRANMGSSGVAIGSARSAVHNRHRCASVDTDHQLKDLFASFDTDRSGFISTDELSNAMEKLGMPTQPEKIAAVLKDADTSGDKLISFAEFASVIERMKTAGAGAKGFEEVVTKQRGAVMQDKKGNVVHSFATEECAALIEFINTKLAHDSKLSYLLPMKDITELFSACVDGVLLCRLINVAAPETVDERVINLAPPNKFLITENLNLALNAAKSLGVKVVNIGASDIVDGRPHLILGLVWQLVKVALLSKINLKENPNLIRLLQEGETLDMLRKLPPEKILMRWMNFHLAEAGSSKRMANFGSDLADSDIYLTVMERIDPEKKATAFVKATDRLERAQLVVGHGTRMGAEFKVAAKDIVAANDKLNLGFVAALFNACPGLDPPDEKENELLSELPDENEGDSREERAFRAWINSLGLEATVSNLFDDVADGMLLLQVMDQVKPGVVEWSKVNKPPFKMVFKKIENMNYAVELGRGSAFGFSLVGVSGKDIADGNKKLTLALVWQLMRGHLLAFLASIRAAGSGSDNEMIKWANERVASTGSSATMRDFGDKSLANGLFLIDLLAAVEPRAIDRKLVTAGESEEDRKLNAKYAISSARKLGCSLFCTWEDITDVKPKMLLSFVATVMSFTMAR